MTTKPNILFVAHNSVLSSSFGGVEAYINTLSKYLKSEYDVYWYVPYIGDDGVGVQLIGPDTKSVKTILLKIPFENWQLSNPEREGAFQKALQDLDIGLVHFHHLAGHPPSLVRIAKEFGARTVFTFHDYFSLCHVSNLINFEGKYCHPDNIPLSSCDTCLNKKYSILPGSQLIRREYWDSLFKYLDGLIFNTQGGFDLVSKIYPEVATHPNVAILPVAIEEVVRPKLPPKTSDELRVAILGNLNHHKGADVIIEAIEQLAKENISFHFFGEIDSVYKEKLALSKNSQIFRYGKYPPGNLPEELFSCDISLHVSICPETYGLTLSEAWGAGLVPIVSDIGALGERVISGKNGIKVPVNSGKDLSEAILKVSSNKSLISQLTASISALPIEGIAQHYRRISALYIKLIFNKSGENKHQYMEISQSDRPILIEWATFNFIRTHNSGLKQKMLFLIKRCLVFFVKN
ncbi:MAG: glycosyltransferase [Polynucleobacter sp.]|nr:glycosyltransferase [Polynucleobacter sp.]